MRENSLPASRPRRGVLSLSLFLAIMLLVVVFQLLLAQGDVPANNETDRLETDASIPGPTITTTGGITESVYLPLLTRSLEAVILSVSQPNSANQWTVSWSAGGAGVTGYILQESQSPNFATLTNEFTLGLVTSQSITHTPSPDNIYFYRVRAVYDTVVSPWSNVVAVRSGYFDDFSNPATGWSLRRSSYWEQTLAYYGSGSEAGNYIIIVADRWDWLLASPLRQAPEIPYVIEYQARVHDPSNLISGGMSFAGDWNGGACPDLNNVYQHTNCFNSFHNLNFIFYGPIKLLYEQVDELVWCPTCGGSLLKRFGPTVDAGDMIPNGPSLDWHTYRVEVRQDGVRIFVDGTFRFHYTGTAHLGQPYFGVFASTDEYKPSIWFFDYFSVMPLD